MQLLCLGLNHTTAPLAIRERVAFGPDEIPGSIETLKSRLGAPQNGGLAEAMILSTCNRTEVYGAAEDPDVAIAGLARAIEDMKGISAGSFEPHTYSYTQAEAARHIFRVVSGIDSMVLGETQIAGQFKKAVAAAKDAGGLKTYLNHLFQDAFTVAKEVRSSTAIGSSSVSFAAAGVRLSERLFGRLDGENVLFVGAGEMIELCAEHFAARHPKSITVANRTAERGERLAGRFGGESMRLQDLPANISRYDVIVSCTASALPIIGLGMMKRAIAERRHRPVCIIDLAVPRDVEEEVSRLDDVYVYTMDDLGAVVQSGRDSRRAAVSDAESIIQVHVGSLENWLEMRETVPVIASIREHAETLRQETLAEAKRRLAAGEDAGSVLETLSLNLMNKLIHDPTKLLRNTQELNRDERAHLKGILSGFYRGRGH